MSFFFIKRLYPTLLESLNLYVRQTFEPSLRWPCNVVVASRRFSLSVEAVDIIMITVFTDKR